MVLEHVSCLVFRDCPKFVSFFIEETARREFVSAFMCVVFYLILRIFFNKIFHMEACKVSLKQIPGKETSSFL